MPVWYREEPNENGDAVEIFRGTVWEMAQALDAAKMEIERLRRDKAALHVILDAYKPDWRDALKAELKAAEAAERGEE